MKWIPKYQKAGKLNFKTTGLQWQQSKQDQEIARNSQSIEILNPTNLKRRLQPAAKNLKTRYNNLSVRQLRERIKSNEYERLPEFTKNKLLNQDKQNVVDFVKNPIKIKNDNKYDILSEKILQKLILEDIENFLEELGIGFTFIKSEYPIKLGNRYNYIDLLLYNIKYRCYVVVELKITELKKEHTGQIMTYMNYIDKNIKTIEENDTVGIIICKQDNKYVIKYCSDERIIAREYKLV